MRRVLPAHVVVGAAVAGLAFANATRIGPAGALVGAAAAALVTLRLHRASPLPAATVFVLVLAWGWGSARLDALDRSVLAAEVGRAGRFVAVVTGEARVGRYAQRLPARVRTFEGHAVAERVELDLPLGRAPPQGAIISTLAVVRAPRGSQNGFDERRWLRRQGVHVVLHVDSCLSRSSTAVEQ